MVTTVHTSMDERIFLKEAVSLAQHGYEVCIIGHHPRVETLQNVRFYPLPQSQNRIRRILLSPWHAFKIARQVKADIYHFHDPELYPLAAMIHWLFRRPVVMDIHEHYGKDIMSKHWIPRYLRSLYCHSFTLIENICLHQIKALIYVVPAIAERYRHFKKSKIEIRNYPILDAFELKYNEHIERDPYRAIYSGAITPDRGVIELIDAMSIICRSIPEAKLDIMGPAISPEFLSFLIDKIKQLNLESQITLIPSVPYHEMKYHLIKASIGYVTLLPRSENLVIALPNKTFEYMACRLAIICSDFPFYRNLMNESKAGVWVDPSDPQKIAAQTIQLMNNPDHCRHLGENGYQMVKTRYSWSAEARKLTAFYHELFQRNSITL